VDPDGAVKGGAEVGIGGRMSDADALLWSIEKDPLLRSTITSISILDRAPDRERLLRRVDRATRRLVRLRQRVVSVPLSIAPPRWEVDPHFDLHYHLRWIRAVGEGTTSELFDLAEPIAMQGFDRARPLWELTVVEGLADGRAAAIMKFHRTITDGIGSMRLQNEFVDHEREPRPRPEDATLPPAPAAPRPAGSRRLAGAVTDETTRQARGAQRMLTAALSSVGHLRQDPVGVAAGTVRNMASVTRMLAPAVEPLSPLLSGRSLSVRFGRIDLPCSALEKVGRLVSGGLTDAVVTGLAGGLARYHRFHGYDDVGALRLAMPLDRLAAPYRSPGEMVTNRFAPMRFIVPLDIGDPLERLGAIRFLIDRQRDEPALALSAPLANLVNRLPATATTALFGMLIRGVDVITATVAGSAGPIFLAGSEVESQLAFAPLTGAGVSVVTMTYGDQLNLAVALDPAAVPDGDTFLDHLRDGFDEVLKLV
jgi:diacylglycerol O-acyltransferase / wax synthase